MSYLFNTNYKILFPRSFVNYYDMNSINAPWSMNGNIKPQENL